MSEATPLPTSDRFLDWLHTRRRELELDIVARKAQHDEISLAIDAYEKRPRGGRRGNKPVAVLNEQLAGRLLAFTGDDPPPDAA